jgi:hypothetical protein
LLYQCTLQAGEGRKGDGNNVGNGLGVIIAFNSICLRQYVYDDDNGDWFYLIGGQIFTLVCPDLSLYPESNVTIDVLTDVVGPHPGERLADHMKCILHCLSSDGVLAGGNSAIAVALANDLQDGDWVFPGPNDVIDSIFEAHPSTPNACLGLWTAEELIRL